MGLDDGPNFLGSDPIYLLRNFLQCVVSQESNYRFVEVSVWMLYLDSSGSRQEQAICYDDCSEGSCFRKREEFLDCLSAY